MENSEIERRTDNLRMAQQLLTGKITPEQFADQQTERELQLERLAFIDPLTGLLNRHGLSHAFDLKLQIAGREMRGGQVDGLKASYLMMDLDGLKQINDTHGHGTGDLVLLYLGQTIQNSLRPTDLAARIGGDEFVIILDGASCNEAVLVAERLRASLSEDEGLFIPNGINVTTSMGIVELPEGISSEQLRQPNFGDVLLHQLYIQADPLLYKAKSRGKNQIATLPIQ